MGIKAVYHKASNTAISSLDAVEGVALMAESLSVTGLAYCKTFEMDAAIDVVESTTKFRAACTAANIDPAELLASMRTRPVR